MTDSPTADLFPDEILGMPVLTVEAASRLLFDGQLDGRAVAIGGYLLKPSFGRGCPAVAARPSILEAYCTYGGIADEPLPLGSHEEHSDGSSSWSWDQPEERVGFLIPVSGETSFSRTGRRGMLLEDEATMSWPVVLIGHAGDPGVWECPPEVRDECRRRLVVDRWAWVDGIDVEFQLDPVEDAPNLNLGQVLAAAGVDQDDAVQIVIISRRFAPIPDPRLIDLDAERLWLVTVAIGPPTTDGTRALELRVVDDATADLMLTMPLAPPHDLRPARLVLMAEDLRTSSGGEWGSVRASVVDASQSRAVVEGWAALNVPIVVPAGNYELSAWIADDDGRELEQTRCTTTVQLAESEDAHWLVRFPESGSCRWERSQRPS